MYLYTRAFANNQMGYASAMAWVLLLAVFEWESTRPVRPRVPPFERATLRAVQAIGYGLASYAWWGYWQEGMWADVVNTALWLAVIGVMAFEVGDPAQDLAGDGNREIAIGGKKVADVVRSSVERFAATKHGVEQLQCGAARGDAIGACHDC